MDVCLTEAVGVHGQRVLLPGIASGMQCHQPQCNTGKHLSPLPLLLADVLNGTVCTFQRSQMLNMATSNSMNPRLGTARSQGGHGTFRCHLPEVLGSCALPARSRLGARVSLRALPAPGRLLLTPVSGNIPQLCFPCRWRLERRGRLLSQRDVRGLLSVPATDAGSLRQAADAKGLNAAPGSSADTIPEPAELELPAPFPQDSHCSPRRWPQPSPPQSAERWRGQRGAAHQACQACQCCRCHLLLQ